MPSALNGYSCTEYPDGMLVLKVPFRFQRRPHYAQTRRLHIIVSYGVLRCFQSDFGSSRGPQIHGSECSGKVWNPVKWRPPDARISQNAAIADQHVIRERGIVRFESGRMSKPVRYHASLQSGCSPCPARINGRCEAASSCQAASSEMQGKKAWSA